MCVRAGAHTRAHARAGMPFQGATPCNGVQRGATDDSAAEPMKFVAVFRAPRNHRDVPPFIRLRRALKRCLRDAGFKCVDVAVVPERNDAAGGNVVAGTGIVAEDSDRTLEIGR